MMDAVETEMQAWIGRSQSAEDVVAPRLVEELRATLDPHLFHTGEEAPLLVHWCLAPPAVALAGLGRDGHPARGDFLPPVPLPRRMWAGGEVEFVDPLRVGDAVTRRSTVARVERKVGRTGELWFVDVAHEVSTPRGLAVRETQSIVYRADGTKSLAAPPPTVAGPDLRREDVAFPSVRLFRYSALTFNGHRIHYDQPYATGVEGYAGLVVHGPLQATLLAHAASRHAGRSIRSLRYRGTAPLTQEAGTLLTATDGDAIRCCMTDPAGGMTMEAMARLS